MINNSLNFELSERFLALLHCTTNDIHSFKPTGFVIPSFHAPARGVRCDNDSEKEFYFFFLSSAFCLTKKQQKVKASDNSRQV